MMNNRIQARWLLAVTGLFRGLSPAMAASGGVLIIAAIALFTHPYIGMADNGDYFRSIYSNGLYFNAPDYESRFFGYFVREYGIFQFFNENGATLDSSQSLLIKLAVALNRLLYSSEVFDIRFLAGIYLTLYVAAVYLLTAAVTHRMSRKAGMLTAALAVFVFADTAYTAYFNSFYGEALALIMMMVLLASWLLLWRGKYNDYAMLALFAVSGLLLTTAKQQNAPVGMILAVFGLALLWIRRERLFRLLTVLSLGLLLFSGVITYLNISGDFVYINQYHAMTRGVLKGSPDPEGALKGFGIDEQYAILKNSVYYELYGTVDVNSPLLKDNFYNRYGFVSIAGYYMSHPGELGSLLNEAARNAFTIRPAAMGNYELEAGKAFGEKTSFFTAYSMLKEKLAPKTFGFIVIWMGLLLGFYAIPFTAAFRKRDYRSMQRMAALVATMLIGLSGMGVSIIGAGDADLAKHEFLFTVTFDLLMVMAAASLFNRFFPADKQVPASVNQPQPAPAVPAASALGGPAAYSDPGRGINV